MPRVSKLSLNEPQELTIQHNIARLRKLKGLTQQELADLIGLSRSGLADIESGKNRVYGEVIAKIAKVLQISTDSILGTSSTEFSDVVPSIRVIRRLQEIEQLPEAKKKAILKTLDDLIRANS